MASMIPKTPYSKNKATKRLKRQVASSLLLGIVRGMGMAIGFSSLAIILLAVTRIIPLHKLPVIGEIIDALIKNRPT